MKNAIAVLFFLLMACVSTVAQENDGIPPTKWLERVMPGIVTWHEFGKGDFLTGKGDIEAGRLFDKSVQTVVLTYSRGRQQLMGDLYFDRLVGQFSSKGLRVLAACQILRDTPAQEAKMVAMALDHSAVMGVVLFPYDADKGNRWQQSDRLMSAINAHRFKSGSLERKLLFLMVPGVLPKGGERQYKELAGNVDFILPLFKVESGQVADTPTVNQVIDDWKSRLSTNWGMIKSVIPVATLPDVSDQVALSETVHNSAFSTVIVASNGITTTEKPVIGYSDDEMHALVTKPAFLRTEAQAGNLFSEVKWVSWWKSKRVLTALFCSIFALALGYSIYAQSRKPRRKPPGKPQGKTVPPDAPAAGPTTS